MLILNHNIKKILAIIIVLLSCKLSAQTSVEGGLNLGSTYYLGELNLNQPFKSADLSFGAFIRYNLNTRWNCQLNVGFGKLSGEDANSESTYQQFRNHTFETRIIDVLPEIAFNFFPYKIGQKQFVEKFTPYVSSGLGVVFISEPSKMSLVVPLTLGFKIELSDKAELGVSTSFRKTFTDKLDNLQENQHVKPPKKNGKPVEVTSFRYKQRNLKYNTDWYVYAGVFFTYKIFQRRTACKAYDF